MEYIIQAAITATPEQIKDAVSHPGVKNIRIATNKDGVLTILHLEQDTIIPYITFCEQDERMGLAKSFCLNYGGYYIGEIEEGSDI